MFGFLFLWIVFFGDRFIYFYYYLVLVSIMVERSIKFWVLFMGVLLFFKVIYCYYFF